MKNKHYFSCKTFRSKLEIYTIIIICFMTTICHCTVFPQSGEPTGSRFSQYQQQYTNNPNHNHHYQSNETDTDKSTRFINGLSRNIPVYEHIDYTNTYSTHMLLYKHIPPYQHISLYQPIPL